MRELMDIQQQTSYNILLIGDSCVDRYHYGECTRLSPEAPVPILRHVKTVEQPGMALNVQENLKAFPVKVDILTNLESVTKERFVDIRSKQHLLRCDFGEKTDLKPVSLGDPIFKKLDHYDAIILSDYNKGYLNNSSIKQLMKILPANIPIFVDTKKKDLSVFENCVIKINEAEYCRLSNEGTSNDIVVTMGDNGVRWNDQIFPTRKVEVFDVSGAGDTFLAALVYGFLNSSSFEKSLIFANKCASIVVQKSGTYALTLQDIVENDICL